MLDQETKRKIDSCRDILVGKVPDPKSQVEQITIALIYKFMDDMDRASEEKGGNPTFFTGEFKKYAWSNIFDARLGGHEITALYGEAIEKMNHNPNIPQLFRDIFKNAYLPYRDPETLRSFLKEINVFTYDHSERLGDAFEYLLSVLGSQGDAGQFRTPRHIIDFIVEVVQPTKNDIVLDPACGTAGFLISAYKHILKRNQKDGKSQLTPDDRTRLMNNFFGYDISPDMVRLSLVNMYLHLFSNPKIFEYDTLTSEDKWNDTADVILANPPFMTPKGGIRPHKRFSVQANRSEVLFVDYIAEHLNPGGRAGVIVPEGIIFQSSNAYKQLRKMLIEDYLWAVISLPAGIFQPYSGVKTSILLMDKAIVKKNNKILFVKIENDGFGLGAQRRPIEKNDLPQALKYIRNYQNFLNSEQGIEPSHLAHTVDKSVIVNSGDLNLTGDRYRVNDELRMSNYEMVELGEVIDINFGTRITKKDNFGSKYPVYGGGGESFRTDTFNRKNEYVIARFAMGNNCVRFVNGKFWMMDSGGTFSINTKFSEQTSKEFIGNILMHNQRAIYSCARGNAQKNLDTKLFKKLQIPLPPISVQQEIVVEIDGYQKIIDGARQVVDNYKPTIKIDPDWEIVPLGDVTDIISGYAFKSSDFSNTNEIKSVKITNVGVKEFYKNANDLLPENFAKEYKRYTVDGNDLVIALTRPIISSGLKVCLVPKSYDGALVNQRVAGIKSIPNQSDIYFVYYYLCTPIAYKFVEDKSKSLMQPNLSVKELSKFPIPLPPLSIQQEIITQIEAEQKMVNANKKLIKIYEQKIKDKIAEVWGE